MPVEEAVLDHVAVAVERWSDAWPQFVESLGGRWSSGGPGVGFSPAQLRFANDARLEVLQPNAVEQNDFLRRFLDASGPGPHHLTFKVPDIDAAIDAATQAGITPVAVDLSDPGWMEAFLHPRQARGVVVQLAQAAGSWESPEPEGFPAAPAGLPAALTHVTHAVADMDDGLELFAGLLGGSTIDLGVGPQGGWRAVEVRWRGPLAVRLVAPTANADQAAPLRQWLGAKTGRVHHLAFAGSLQLDETAQQNVAGVFRHEGPVCVIEPPAPLGVRVVVRSERVPGTQ